MNFDRIKELRADHLLLILALILAFGIRFYNLGYAALSDAESGWAMDALMVSQGDIQDGSTIIGPQPAYIFLTATLFSMFGSSNFLARFFPALAGGLLVLFPFLLRNAPRLKNIFSKQSIKVAAIVLAFAIALDPALVTISREAGGPMPGLAFSMLAIGFWVARKPALAGVSAGVALLSGPSVILGLLGLTAAWLIVRLLILAERGSQTEYPADTGSENTRIDPYEFPTDTQTELRQFMISLVSAIVLIGTLFMIYPQGIGAWFNSIPTFISGWTLPPQIPISRFPISLLVYELMAVTFSLALAVQYFASPDRRNPRKTRLFLFVALWTVVGLIIMMFYPARLISDLVWLVLPLWTLAAFGITYLIPGERVNPISIIQAVFLLVLSGLFWYTFAATTRSPYGISQYISQFAIMAGILALGGLTTVLVALGWNWRVGLSGLFLGIAAALLIYSISVMWGASILRQNQASELLSTTPATGQTKLAGKVIAEFSNWNTGFSQYIDIISLVEASSIKWVFREHPDFDTRPNLENGSMPSIVITREGSNIPSLNANYRGEDFVWWSSPGWQGALPLDTARWLTFREAPLVKDKVIIWFRSDLFTDSETEVFE